MNKSYVTVTCPRCNSTSQLKMNGVRPAKICCPVCLEGEIENPIKKPDAVAVNGKSVVCLGRLVC